MNERPISIEQLESWRREAEGLDKLAAHDLTAEPASRCLT